MVKKKTILVVGGTGFIGSSLIKYFTKKKFKVVSLSKKKPKKKEAIKEATYLTGDFCKNFYIKKIEKIKIHYVINAGGYVDHSEDPKKRKYIYGSHYLACQRLANVFLKKKIELFLQIGTGNEYGHTRSPNNENSLCRPISTYAKAKLKATKHLLKLNKEYNFPTVIFRIYQLFGPHQNSNRLIPQTIKACLSNLDFNCTNGKQIRDFLYINDFVLSVNNLIKYKNKAIGNIFNIGSSKPHSVKKIIELINDNLNSGRPKFGKIKIRKKEVLRNFPNIRKAKKLIYWTPKHTLNQGLKKTINYYLDETKK